MLDFRLLVILEAMNDAEAVAKRAGKGTGAGGGADDGEVWQVEADASGAWAFADNDVELVVFHGGVEDFLYGAAEAVNFIDKKNVAVF